MKKLIISIGPIPACIDSVKYITNRFKGGLALKTLNDLLSIEANNAIEATIIKWKFTELPKDINQNIKVININDVYEYYTFFQNNAVNYDIFIMAGAVANLTPVEPWKGKFPSHLYKEGQKFNIEFQIAPRSIDIIKKLNPRACLIGYKLFDTKSEEELIQAAQTVLVESKANLVFANTPEKAKEEKIALTQDGAIIHCNFADHVFLISKLINSHFYKTIITEENINKNIHKENLIKLFEKNIEKYGTIAFQNNLGIITTSRGHQKDKACYITDVNSDKLIIKSSDKATLNAPLLFKYLNNHPNFDYVVHRHKQIENLENYEYQFPGTHEEAIYSIADNLNIQNHGYIKGYNIQKVNWEKYYDIFPIKYFNTNKEIQKIIDKYGRTVIYDSLEVGSNINSECKYSIDPYVKCINSININYSDIVEKNMQFDCIILRNSINYLTKNEILILKNALKYTGVFIANTFIEAPKEKLTNNEYVYTENNIVHHYLLHGDNFYYHNFYNRNEEFYKKLGFNIEKYNLNSMLIKFIKQ